jgi:hypothetical protein
MQGFLGSTDGRSTTRTCDPPIKSVLSWPETAHFPSISPRAERPFCIGFQSATEHPKLVGRSGEARPPAACRSCLYARIAELLRDPPHTVYPIQRAAPGGSGGLLPQSRTPSDATDRRRMLIMWFVVAPSGSAADGDHVELRPTAKHGPDRRGRRCGDEFPFYVRSLSVCKGSTKVACLPIYRTGAVPM